MKYGQLVAGIFLGEEKLCVLRVERWVLGFES